jgi:hypothetical protein
MLITGNPTNDANNLQEVEVKNNALQIGIDQTTQGVTNGVSLTTALSKDIDSIDVGKKSKGGTQTLYGGAISASVTEANTTEIDMNGYAGGSLEVTINSGTGTWSLAFYTHEISGGTFVPMNIQKDDGSFVAAPAIAQSNASASYTIKNIRANYLKIVPTITGTSNATFKFTPTVD